MGERHRNGWPSPVPLVDFVRCSCALGGRRVHGADDFIRQTRQVSRKARGDVFHIFFRADNLLNRTPDDQMGAYLRGALGDQGESRPLVTHPCGLPPRSPYDNGLHHHLLSRAGMR
jgi:hypothetical protein